MADHDGVMRARAIYDATAPQYARVVGATISPTTETAEDRRRLEDLVAAAGAGPVADLGSGPGRVAAICRGRAVASVAADMAVAMLRIGREHHQDVPFVAAYLSTLPFAAGSFSAAVLWYSIIHTPPADLHAVFAEVRRVVKPGSPVLVAFQAGDGEARDRPNAYGTGVTMTSWLHAPGLVTAVLRSSGLDATDAELRPPELDHESAPQAFITAIAAP